MNFEFYLLYMNQKYKIRTTPQLNNSLSKYKYSFGTKKRDTGFGKPSICQNIYSPKGGLLSTKSYKFPF